MRQALEDPDFIVEDRTLVVLEAFYVEAIVVN